MSDKITSDLLEDKTKQLYEFTNTDFFPIYMEYVVAKVLDRLMEVRVLQDPFKVKVIQGQVLGLEQLLNDLDSIRNIKFKAEGKEVEDPQKFFNQYKKLLLKI